MKRILAYKANFNFLAGGTFGQGPNVGPNLPGRLRLAGSGQKMESQLNPGEMVRTGFWPVFGEAGGRL